VSFSLPILTHAQHPVGGPRLPTPAHAPHTHRRMIDSHGRTIRELRLSITDRCNFRCTYCMEPDVRFMPASESLSVDELIRAARLCVSLGVKKVRITGGEPTLHPRLPAIIQGLAALEINDLAMTTNGSLATPPALAAWKAAGLRRITFSIDSLRPETFAAITRSATSPDQVVQAIAAAQRAGFEHVKVNAVVVRGVNEEAVGPLTLLARDMGFEMRFIEFMPLDSARAWDTASLVPASEIASLVHAAAPVKPIGRRDESGTAEIYEFQSSARSGGAAPSGSVGIIAPVTRSFCGACSRLRITADGKIRPCLFSTDEYDLRGPMRRGASDDELAQTLIDATFTKQAGHGITSAGFTQPARPMSAIGG